MNQNNYAMSVVRAVIVGVVAAGGAACSAAPAPGGPPQPERAAAAAGPRDGDNYVVFYHEGSAIHRLDTRTGDDGVMLVGVDEVVTRRVAPGGGAVAVALRSGDSSAVVLLSADNSEAAYLHRGGPETAYTMAWSTDGTRLGIGHRGGGSGGVVIAQADGSTQSMGCRASNRFEAWRSATEAVVHDGRNFYAVRASNCETLATFPMRGKSDIVYSADGRRVAFFRDRTVTFRNNPQPQTIPELYVANYNGAGAQVIADVQSRAQHPRWAPDAARVAFEVLSSQYRNVSHVAIYDFSTGRATFDSEPKSLGIPNDGNVCWSFDGARLAHERTYTRNTGTQTYATRQVVVRDVASGEERVVSEELVSEPGAEVIESDSESCGWVGPGHLIVQRSDGMSIVNVDTNDEMLLAPGKNVLLAQPVPVP